MYTGPSLHERVTLTYELSKILSSHAIIPEVRCTYLRLSCLSYPGSSLVVNCLLVETIIIVRHFKASLEGHLCTTVRHILQRGSLRYATKLTCKKSFMGDKGSLSSVHLGALDQCRTLTDHLFRIKLLKLNHTQCRVYIPPDLKIELPSVSPGG